MPSDAYPLAEREFTTALQAVDGEFQVLRAQGKPRWFLAAYLTEKNQELVAKFSAKKEKALTDFFRQRQALLEAMEGAYQAQERSTTLKQRTQLQTEAEVAKLEAEHQYAGQTERLKYEAETADLRAKLAEAKAREAQAVELGQFDTERKRLEAQAEIARLKRQLADKPEPKKLSRDEQLVERLAALPLQEKRLVESGLSPEEAKKITAAAEREIRAEFRLKGS